MRIVGRIDAARFKDVADNIHTDEVVMTDERIEHMEQNHQKQKDSLQESIVSL